MQLLGGTASPTLASEKRSGMQLFRITAAAFVLLASSASAQWITTNFYRGQTYTNTMAMDMWDALEERQWAATLPDSPAPAPRLPQYLGGSLRGTTRGELEHDYLVYDDQYFSMTQVVASVTNTIRVYTNTVSSTRTNRDNFLPWVEYGHTNVPMLSSWSQAYPLEESVLRYIDRAIWDLCDSLFYVSPRHYTDRTYTPFGAQPSGVPVPIGSYTNFDSWFNTPYITDTETNYPNDFPIASVADLFEIASAVGHRSLTETNTFRTATQGNTQFTLVSTNAVHDTTIFYTVRDEFGWPIQARTYTVKKGWIYGPYPVLVFSPAVITNNITISGTVSARAFSTNTAAWDFADQQENEESEIFSISYAAGTTNAYFALANLYTSFRDDDQDGITVTASTSTNIGDTLRVAYTNGATYSGHPNRGGKGWYQNIVSTPSDFMLSERYQIWDLLYLTKPDDRTEVSENDTDPVPTARGIRRWSGYGWAEASANLELVTDQTPRKWPQARMDYVDFDPDVATGSSVGEAGLGPILFTLSDPDAFYVTNYSRAGWTYKTEYDSAGSLEITNTYLGATAFYDLSVVSGGVTGYVGSGTLLAGEAVVKNWAIADSIKILSDGDNAVSWSVIDHGGTETVKLRALNKSAGVASKNYIGAWLDSRRVVERVEVTGIVTNYASLRAWYTKSLDDVPFINASNWPSQVGTILNNDYGSTYSYTVPHPLNNESRLFFALATNEVQWLNSTSYYGRGIADFPHQVFKFNVYTNQIGYSYAEESFLLHCDWQYPADGFQKIWGRD
jgi:hypothetical protein